MVHQRASKSLVAHKLWQYFRGAPFISLIAAS
jgi:hypothetical protein